MLLLFELSLCCIAGNTVKIPSWPRCGGLILNLLNLIFIYSFLLVSFTVSFVYFSLSFFWGGLLSSPLFFYSFLSSCMPGVAPDLASFSFHLYCQQALRQILSHSPSSAWRHLDVRSAKACWNRNRLRLCLHRIQLYSGRYNMTWPWYISIITALVLKPDNL